MRKTPVLVFATMLTAASLGMAGTITVTLGQYESPYHPEGTYYDIYHVGTFLYALPIGETIVSASINGKWGNSINPTSAYNLLFVGAMPPGGLLVADSRLATPDPYDNPDVPWSYVFSDFTPLLSGNVDFWTVQLSEKYVQLGPTTLTIETAPTGVPEPSYLLLLGAGLGSVGLFSWCMKK